MRSDAPVALHPDGEGWVFLRRSRATGRPPMRETASRGPYKAVCARRESTGPAARPITGRLPTQGTRRKQTAGRAGSTAANGGFGDGPWSGWERMQSLAACMRHRDPAGPTAYSPSDTAAAVPRWPVDQILVPGTSRRSGDLFQEPLRVAWIDLWTGGPPPLSKRPRTAALARFQRRHGSLGTPIGQGPGPDPDLSGRQLGWLRVVG